MLLICCACHGGYLSCLCDPQDNKVGGEEVEQVECSQRVLLRPTPTVRHCPMRHPLHLGELRRLKIEAKDAVHDSISPRAHRQLCRLYVLQSSLSGSLGNPLLIPSVISSSCAEHIFLLKEGLPVQEAMLKPSQELR